MSYIDFDELDVLTFDCYGTLVDWERGILDALRPVLVSHGVSASDHEVLESYAEIEPALQGGAYRPYREILVGVVRAIGDRYGFEPDADEEGVLVESIGSWPPFSDAVDSLRRLKSRYRLGVISNVDAALFEPTAERLRVPFDYVVTAEHAGAYKPDPRPFELAIEATDTSQTRVLHVAQSLFHDILPAKSLGFPCVWVNRRAGMNGSGATPEVDVDSASRPDMVVPDLRSLASLMGLF